MEILDKLPYIVGPVVAAIVLYVRYRWRREDQGQQKREKKFTERV